MTNGDTYEVRIHERYGDAPRHYREYVFDTPADQEYAGRFIAGKNGGLQGRRFHI